MSQISTFFVPLADGEAAQDEMNAFLRAHRVLHIDKAFAQSGWAFCVEWLEGAGMKPTDWKQNRIDYREVLEPEVFARFAKMRERRKAIAQEDGVPPYMVITDAQIAKAVKAGEPTQEILKDIEGFGPARLAKYGDRLCPASS